MFLPLHFYSCPVEPIMIFGLLNKWTPFPISRSEVFCEFLAEKVGAFVGKCQQSNPVLIKLQGNISRTGLRHRHSPWAFPILEQTFCRPHASISFWPSDSFLGFNREACCLVFWNLPLTGAWKTVTQKLPRKEIHRKPSFLKELHGYSLQACFKLFTAPALSSR